MEATKNPEHSMVGAVVYTGVLRKARAKIRFITSDNAITQALDTEELKSIATNIEDVAR